MLSTEQRRFGYITPLSVSYFFVRLVIVANILAFISLFFVSGAVLNNPRDGRLIKVTTVGNDTTVSYTGINWTYVRTYSVAVSIGTPWYMEFWLSHTFFRIYYWILWIVLGVCIVWHAVQLIFYLVVDWANRTAFYEGIDFEAKGDYAFWLWVSLTGLLIFIYVLYLLFAVYIRRRTVDRMVLEAQTQANAISPSGLNPLLMDPNQQSLGAGRDGDATPRPSPFFTVGGSSNFPVMVPVGADLSQHPEGEQMRKNAQLLQDAGYDIELLALGVPLLQTRYSEDIGCHNEDGGANRRKKKHQKAVNAELDNEGFLP